MLFLKKILILFLTMAAMIAAYFIYEFLRKKINPRRSVLYFIAFFLANIIVVFGLIFLLSFLLFQFKDFFFKP